jgi:hypothetical protein
MDRVTTGADDMALENMIDRASLAAVLDALRQIADAKAEHIETAWQDFPTARPWRRAANRLTTLQRHVQQEGI